MRLFLENDSDRGFEQEITWKTVPGKSFSFESQEYIII